MGSRQDKGIGIQQEVLASEGEEQERTEVRGGGGTKHAGGDMVIIDITGGFWFQLFEQIYCQTGLKAGTAVKRRIACKVPIFVVESLLPRRTNWLSRGIPAGHKQETRDLEEEIDLLLMEVVMTFIRIGYVHFETVSQL